MTGNSTAPGIIPRAISEIFSIIETTTTASIAATASNEAYFYVRLSYVELYNNNFRNLLELSNSNNSGSGTSSSGTSYSMSSARDNYPTTHSNSTNNNYNNSNSSGGGEPIPTPRSSYTGSVAKLGDLEDRFNQGMIYMYVYV